MDDPTKDTIPRSAVEYCLRKETVNTNPDAYESHERFIAYMDDPDISQFGHWMHSNGFNCALTAISVDLEKIPSVTLSTQPGWIPCSERLPYAEYGESDTVLTTCGYRDVEDTSVRWIRLLYFNGGNWCYPTGETYEAKVYAWMPLPKPWEGGQHE